MTVTDVINSYLTKIGELRAMKIDQEYCDKLNAPLELLTNRTADNGAVIFGSPVDGITATQVIRRWLNKVGLEQTKGILLTDVNEPYHTSLEAAIDLEFQNGIEGGWYDKPTKT